MSCGATHVSSRPGRYASRANVWRDCMGDIRYASGQILPAQPEEFTEPAAAQESIWPQTDARLKKRIVRTLIHEVVVDLDDETSEFVLVIHWKAASIQKSAYPDGAVADTRARPKRRSSPTC
jgi:hypothetical protein